ncbi:MAG: putative membrane protein [Candidatus Methanohalarchaeum thermophilum]|uniref:Membrane protein n=1 Tax=Methanohalarchaeum thermophilum TaxID=1903181 RepID=A0A1Q6DTY6_METT1|nr:MAG: putative membrane protein [Candidatus Methanohalarchaeum thermophilum]
MLSDEILEKARIFLKNERLSRIELYSITSIAVIIFFIKFIFIFRSVTSNTKSIQSILITSIPLVFTIFIIYLTYRISKKENKPEHLSRIFIWFIIGLTFSGLITINNLYYQLEKGVIMANKGLVFLNNISIGGLSGLLIGIFNTTNMKNITKISKEKEKRKMLNSLLTHDIKNTSQVVLGYLEILKEELKDQKKTKKN